MQHKCLITQIVDDHTECMTMEEAEREFGIELASIMLGRNDRFVGSLVSEDTPLGYVADGPSLLSYEVYACNRMDTYG